MMNTTNSLIHKICISGLKDFLFFTLALSFVYQMNNPGDIETMTHFLLYSASSCHSFSNLFFHATTWIFLPKEWAINIACCLEAFIFSTHLSLENLSVVFLRLVCSVGLILQLDLRALFSTTTIFFPLCGLKKTTFCVVCYKQWSRKMTAIKLDRISSFLPKNSCTSFQHYSNIFSDLHWPSAMFYCFQGHTLMEQAEYMRMECVYLFIATLVYRKISFDGKKSNGTFLGVSCQYSGIFCKIKNSF